MLRASDSIEAAGARPDEGERVRFVIIDARAFGAYWAQQATSVATTASAAAKDKYFASFRRSLNMFSDFFAFEPLEPVEESLS